MYFADLSNPLLLDHRTNLCSYLLLLCINIPCKRRLLNMYGKGLLESMMYRLQSHTPILLLEAYLLKYLEIRMKDIAKLNRSLQNQHCMMLVVNMALESMKLLRKNSPPHNYCYK